MNGRLAALRRLAPELYDELWVRYELLEGIASLSPVGRRALAEHTELTERTVRTNADRLRELGLVEYGALGMTLSLEGSTLLNELRGAFELYHADPLVQRLRRELGIDTVIVVPGDSSSDTVSAVSLYKSAAQYLTHVSSDSLTMAVMGGSTMSGVARCIRGKRKLSNVTVVPARGGLGEEAQYQANTVAVELAEHMGAQCRIVHFSDDMNPVGLGEQATRRFEAWQGIIRGADVLVFGIGRADKMAKRRALSTAQWDRIYKSGAIAEALGAYFDRSGLMVEQAAQLGADINDLRNIPQRIAVAGGTDKAEAVLAVARGVKPTALVTDEAAAGAVCVLLDSGQ